MKKVQSQELRPRELDVFSARVRDARLLAGLRSSEAADHLGITRVRYSRLETSSSTVSIDENLLRQLGTLYGFESRFFTVAPSANAVSNGLRFRAQRSMTKFDEEAIEVWSRVASELLEVVSLHIKPIPLLVPTFEVTPGPEQSADEVRRLLGIDVDEPVVHVIRAIERAGVPVLCAPFDVRGAAKHDAVSLWTGVQFDRPLVLLRQTNSWERIRMSAAHELGHLVLHRWHVPENAEDEAFAFGSAFLMPARGFRMDWPGRVTLANLMPLKRKWGVSLAALIERAYRLGLVGAELRSGLYKQLSARRNSETGKTWRVEEPGSTEREPEAPWLVGKMIETAYGPEGSASALSDEIGYWPPKFVSPLLQGQRKPKRRLQSLGLAERAEPTSNVTPIFGR